MTGVIARREAGLLSLLPAVRTGTGDYARWFGADFEDLVQTTPELITERTAAQSETSSFMIAPCSRASDTRRRLFAIMSP